MTTDQLQVLNEIDTKIKFHKSEWKAIEQKRIDLTRHKKELITIGYNNHNYDRESVGIRKSHLITVLQVEEQYHYQEMRKYERMLKNVLVWKV